MSWSAHEAVKDVYIGDKQASLDLHWLRQQKVKLIVNCTDDLRCWYREELEYVRLPVRDDLTAAQNEKMVDHLPAVIAKIIAATEKAHRVLVHCYAGRQRSAAVVAAYMVHTTGQPWQETVKTVQAARRIAFTPAINFARALEKYQQSLYKDDIFPQPMLLG